MRAFRSCPVRPSRRRAADDVRRLASELGYPVAIKASAGGGGKGLRVVRSEDEIERAFETARREGEAYFADATVYVERYLENPRHVEVQILADAHGDSRPPRRARLHDPAAAPEARRGDALARRRRRPPRAHRSHRGRCSPGSQYRSAGTVEGLLTSDGSYYFLEMNTRIQVEHTVTEAVTGIDIVREQVSIAGGEPLAFGQEDVQLRGHSIECRINAEDVTRGFLPSPGRITSYREPAGIGVRVDSGVAAGDEISDLYDPLIAKLIVHDVDREHARRRMLRALEEFVVEGPATLSDSTAPCCRRRASSTRRRAKEWWSRMSWPAARRSWTISCLMRERSVPAGVGRRSAADTRERVVAVELDGRRHELRIHTTEPPWTELARRHQERSKGLGGEATRAVTSPMQGLVLEVAVAEGGRVATGDLICVVEAMKMENEIVAHRDGVVAELAVAAGQQVVHGQADLRSRGRSDGGRPGRLAGSAYRSGCAWSVIQTT